MELRLVRTQESDDATIGVLYNGTNFVCYTLEDEFRENKVKGETRIPAGEYEIKFRKVESPKTTKYRNRFSWFEWHLELQNVPNFKYVYIHIGNTDDDSEGCILVGLGADTRHFRITESVKAFEKVYKMIVKELVSGEKVTIKIINKN